MTGVIEMTPKTENGAPPLTNSLLAKTILIMMLKKIMMVVELSGRLDGQASDWRTGSDQEALPPQHIIDPRIWAPRGIFSTIYFKIFCSLETDIKNVLKIFHFQIILNLLENAIPLLHCCSTPHYIKSG